MRISCECVKLKSAKSRWANAFHCLTPSKCNGILWNGTDNYSPVSPCGCERVDRLLPTVDLPCHSVGGSAQNRHMLCSRKCTANTKLYVNLCKTRVFYVLYRWTTPPPAPPCNCPPICCHFDCFFRTFNQQLKYLKFKRSNTTMGDNKWRFIECAGVCSGSETDRGTIGEQIIGFRRSFIHILKFNHKFKWRFSIAVNRSL